MKVLLDTNFVLTCVKENVYFDRLAEELFPDKQIQWVVPQEVLNELGNIKDNAGTSSKDKTYAQIAFQVLQALKPEIVELGGNHPNIDIRIVNYIVDKDITLATLDKDLKKRVDNDIMTLRGKKKLVIL